VLVSPENENRPSRNLGSGYAGLGHSTITMTLRYAHLAPEHKANAVAKIAFGTSTKGKIIPFKKIG
jgi:hypothetical protein